MTVEVYNEGLKYSALQADWRRLQRHPNTDLDHYALYLGHQGTAARPWVMVVRNAGAVESIMVGRVDAERAAVRLGYWTLELGRMASLRILTEGVLGTLSADSAGLVVQKLCESLAEGEADRMVLCNIRTDHVLFHAARNAPPKFLPTVLSQPQPHRRMQLPENAAAFWAGLSRKHRYWLKRLGKQVENDFPKSLEYTLVKDPAGVDALCSVAEEVARKTYQRGLGVGFKNDAFHRDRCKLFAEKGIFRGWIVRLGGVPRAFWLGCVYGDTFHSEFTGYDADLRKYELGSLLFAHMVEELILEKIRFIDFGLGDALYKQRFGTESWEECDVALWAPTARNRIMTLLTRTAKGCKAAAMKLPFIGRLKRAWRDRVAQEARDHQSGDSEG
jgi:CelD/BcsL family acetyltransferase involved in cellulose biosynthesis